MRFHRRRLKTAAWLATFCLIPGGYVLAGNADILGGDWRPIHADIEEFLEPETIDCRNAADSCTEEHGTYPRDPYYRITVSGDQATLISDGTIEAEVTQVPGEPRTFTLSGKDIPAGATLTIGGDRCLGKTPCFEVSGMTAAGDLVDGAYVQLQPKAPNDTNKQTLADRFNHQPASFELVTRCYDLRTMDLDNFEGSGCNVPLFALPPDNSTDYTPVSAPDGTPLAVPYGWKYVPRSESWGRNTSRVLDTGQDVDRSFQRSIGFHAGLNLLIADFSVHANKTVRNRVASMQAEELSYSQYDYLGTLFAIVLDKANAFLHPDFVEQVRTLPETKAYDELIKTWGTHYAYATTFGQRGSLFSRYRTDQIIRIHEEEVDISLGASAGFSVPDEGGAGAGVDYQTRQKHQTQMKSILNENYGKTHCIGTMHCASGHPGGTWVAPVLLDLRPISDLLGPPFFSGEPDVVALREELGEFIRQTAFYEDDGSGEPAARFFLLAGASPPTCRAAPFPPDAMQTIPLTCPGPCKAAGLTVSVGQSTVTTVGAGKIDKVLKNVPRNSDLEVSGNFSVGCDCGSQHNFQPPWHASAKQTLRPGRTSYMFELVDPRCPGATVNLVVQGGAVTASNLLLNR